MLSVLFASVTDTTVPAGDYVPGSTNNGFGSTVADVISTVVDNLGNNVYQTGLALVIATAAIVAMLNVGVHIDPAAVNDPELLIRSLKEGFAELTAAGRLDRRGVEGHDLRFHPLG